MESPTKENRSPTEAESKRDSGLARTSTLSWQRRPESRGGSGRPLSMVAAQNATQRSLRGSQEPAAAEETVSRDQIAQALGSKDPAWFRQTADRGQGSAAFRRNQVEDTDRLDMASVKAQLPGMSKDTSRDLSPPKSTTPNRLASPLPLNPPAHVDTTEELPGRTSPTRSTSPTKGMGGFVQSAMMKRSDSVKRWTVTSPPGLARVDSVAANRNSTYDRLTSPSGPRPMGGSRGASTTPSNSRPTSRHEEKDFDTEVRNTDAERSGSRSPTKNEDASLPSSPSKTMDPRRWSPTKASWLESALNKPESPKPELKPAASSQPAWMAALNKNKAERATNPSPETSKPVSAHKHQVSIGGLMRSSPMGATAKSGSPAIGTYKSPSPALGHASTPSLSKKVESMPTKDLEADLSADVPEEPAVKESPVIASKPKSKPETPPKKDFRAGLKQRTADAGPAKSEQPEFKNALGNLRRAQTKNYVAPDELKSNITRGKAALAVTGGPQKAERKDEFKDAILQKKDDFKKVQAEGKGIVRSNTKSGDKPMPEGLAKRAQMGISGVPQRDGSSDVKPLQPKKLDTKPSPGPKRIPSRTSSPVAKSPAPEPERPRRVQTESSLAEPTAPRALPGLHKETSAPTKLQGRAETSKLAGRFNPGLAQMLARGPPTSSGKGDSESDAKVTDTTEPAAPGPQLSHMTKNRARGPRRKAPTSTATAVKTPSPTKGSSPAPSSSPPKSTPVTSQKLHEKPSLTDDKNASETANPAMSVQQQVAAKAALRQPSPRGFGSRESSAKPSSPFQAKPLSVEKPKPTDVPAPMKPQKTGDVSQPGSPKKLDMKRVSRYFDEKPEDKPVEDVRPLTRQRTGSPVKVEQTPVKIDTPAKDVSVLNRTKSPPIKPQPLRRDSPQPEPAKPSTPARALPEPPKPAANTSSQIGGASAMLDDFFGPNRTRKPLKVDPAEMLMNRPPAGAKVRTTGCQMIRISGDGKTIPIPAHHERTLFEQEMYICSHDFINLAGKKLTEVYFWIGDSVPASAAEDAQLFAQGEARSLGSSLVKLPQGKETAEFLQALGGIVITRRGSSNKFDSLAPSMLCGRRFLGQVVFDEVDLAPNSLCAGFPYLIAEGGKCHLWQGKGAGVDELSAARLVGMELALMGELSEVADGKEPETFWDVFGPGSRKPHSADHWRLKPKYSKYCSRLFSSDADSRQQVCPRPPSPVHH